MSNEITIWTTLIPTIIGGAIAIGGSIAAPICVEYVKRKAERSSLTGALVGEISAIVEISERRGYIEHLRQIIAKAKAETNPDMGHRFFFSSRRNSFSVYDANLNRLGILRDPLPQLIVRFYTQTASILEDIADMREGKPLRNRDDSIKTLESLLKLFEDTHSLGLQIIEISKN
jgi:hypothetical protein